MLLHVIYSTCIYHTRLLVYSSPSLYLLMVCIVMIESLLQGVGMDSIEDKVREVVDEDVPVSPQHTDPHYTSLLP